MQMRDDPTSVMLFAAGFGSRMKPLTDAMPKPLVKVAGRALLDHALVHTDLDFIETRVVNIHYRGEQIRAHVGDKDILISDESDVILDTGGGLKKALPLFGSTSVFTLNTDAVWTGQNPLEQLRSAWNPDVMDALLLLASPEKATGHKGHGDFTMTTDGSLSRGSGNVFLGAQIVKKPAVLDVPDTIFSLNRVWDNLIPHGRLYGVQHAGRWCDVGYPQAIATAEDLLRNA